MPLLRKGKCGPKINAILFFSIYVFFQEHSRFTEQEGKGEVISLTPFYHLQLLYKHLHIIWVISAESALFTQPTPRLKPGTVSSQRKLPTTNLYMLEN